MARVEPVDISQYVELRTMLDSVVAGSLRYYLNPVESDKQQEKYEFLRKYLMIISDRVWDREKPGTNDPCPDGYFNCGGCCVPYECVLSEPQPDPKPY